MGQHVSEFLLLCLLCIFLNWIQGMEWADKVRDIGFTGCKPHPIYVHKCFALQYVWALRIQYCIIFTILSICKYFSWHLLAFVKQGTVERYRK